MDINLIIDSVIIPSIPKNSKLTGYNGTLAEYLNNIAGSNSVAAVSLDGIKFDYSGEAQTYETEIPFVCEIMFSGINATSECNALLLEFLSGITDAEFNGTVFIIQGITRVKDDDATLCFYDVAFSLSTGISYKQ